MRKLSYVLLAVLIVLAVYAPAVEAAADIDFVATNYYWDGPYRVAVEGYFENTGNKVITGITYFDLTVYFSRGGDYYYLGKGIWSNNAKLTHIELAPGEKSFWTFRVTTDQHPAVYYWNYKSYTEYNYLR